MLEIMKANLDESLMNFTQDMEETMDKNDDFLTTNKQERILYFHQWVESLHEGGLTYVEAVVDFCDKHDIEYENAVRLITPSLKCKIYEESVKLHQIKHDIEYDTAIFS